VAEAGRAAGQVEAVTALCQGILGRVWTENDRREGFRVGARPGTAREWWPQHLEDTTIWNENYGWGATTANLLLRHVIGFAPDRDTGSVAFELTPGLPAHLRMPGTRLAMANLHYRAAHFDLIYLPQAGDGLKVEVVPPSAAHLHVIDQTGEPIGVEREGERFIFQARQGRRYRVVLT
jgi:hypothetical protein